MSSVLNLKRRYKYYLVGVGIYAGFFALLSIVFGEGYFFTLEGQLMFFEDYFIPGSVIGANFLFDRYLIRRSYDLTIWRKVLMKLTLSLVVIFISTSFTNELERIIGFVDGDIMVIGDLIEFDAYMTNTITNLILVVILGIPTFYREGYIDQKELNLLQEANRVEDLTKELDVLKLQLHSANVKPHFIFNTLNSVVSLIDLDPKKAEELVIHLSDFLRQSIYSSNQNHHTLSEELSAINNYLEIEKIRFGDQVHFRIDCASVLNNLIVPKFFLLPMVENAIKHNRETKDLRIEVVIKESSSGFNVEVIDNGKPFPGNLKWNAGVAGTNALLKAFYDNNFKLEFLNSPNKLVKIQIILD